MKKKASTKNSSKRSAIMRAIRSGNTAPERAVRSIVRALGHRYLTHVKSLPGRPDIVMPKMRKAILVHGCFWHGHACARGARVPKTNTRYWVAKVTGNMKRDRRTRRKLRKLGWSVMTIWECRVRDRALKRRIARFLDKPALKIQV